MKVIRADKSVYVEGDESAIDYMVKAGVVEGIASRSGVVRLLRMICSEQDAIARMAEVKAAECAFAPTKGSLLTQASVTVFREPLPDGFWTWTHCANRGLRFAA
jgi:hypothetical protein